MGPGSGWCGTRGGGVAVCPTMCSGGEAPQRAVNDASECSRSGFSAAAIISAAATSGEAAINVWIWLIVVPRASTAERLIRRHGRITSAGPSAGQLPVGSVDLMHLDTRRRQLTSQLEATGAAPLYRCRRLRVMAAGHADMATHRSLVTRVFPTPESQPGTTGATGPEGGLWRGGRPPDRTHPRHVAQADRGVAPLPTSASGPPKPSTT